MHCNLFSKRHGFSSHATFCAYILVFILQTFKIWEEDKKITLQEQHYKKLKEQKRKEREEIEKTMEKRKDAEAAFKCWYVRVLNILFSTSSISTKTCTKYRFKCKLDYGSTLPELGLIGGLN